MSLLTRHLHQKVTHWVSSSIDGSFDPSFDTTVALLGRWENRVIKFIDEQGAERDSKAIVYLSVDVSLGDYLFEGTSVAVDPTAVDDAFEVRDFRTVPSVNNTNTERRAIL